MVIVISAAFALAGLSGLGVSLYLKAQAATENCEAIDENNEILRDLVVHVRNRSLQSIKAGVTKDITPADVRAFYSPTIRRIDEVSC